MKVPIDKHTQFNYTLGMKKKRKLVGRMVQVVFRIPPEAEDKLRAIAKRECRSYSSVLRQAITEWLAKKKG
jgi:hypothetical protein